MKTTLTWVGGAAFVGKSPGGHRIVMDGPPEGGGRDLGPRPMETLLLGMGACASYDVVSILRKARQDLDDCRVQRVVILSDQRVVAVSGQQVLEMSTHGEHSVTINASQLESGMYFLRFHTEGGNVAVEKIILK